MAENNIRDVTTEEVAQLAIEPAEVLDMILQGRSISIIDIRRQGADDPHALNFGKKARVFQKPYPAFDEVSAIAGELPSGEETIVVCATSRTARAAAADLEAAGASVRYLLGGTRGWDQFYDLREVIRSRSGVVFQIARQGRGDLSYVLISRGEAAVIDPLRRISPYLELIASEGAKLAWVLDTHAHADHISGGAAMASVEEVPYYLHSYDAIHPVDMLPAAIPFTPLEDGTILKIGAASGQVIWFPGHTLGLVLLSFDLDDRTLLFTADGVFHDSIGRPDLGGKAEGWAGLLHGSISARLPRLADDALVLPGHFAHFEEGENGVYASDLGRLRQQNAWLDAGDRETFITRALEHLPTLPESYIEMKRINAGLATADEERALELEAGPNLCAVSG